MSKPTGMTADFRITRPSRVEDLIWDAVREAVTDKWTPTRVIKEMWQAWESALTDDKRDADKEFAKLLK